MMWTLHIPEYETGNDRTNKSHRWLSPFTVVRVGIFLSVIFLLWPLDLVGAFSSVRIRNSCVTAIQHSTCPNDDISSGRHRISTIRLSAKKKKKSDDSSKGMMAFPKLELDFFEEPYAPVKKVNSEDDDNDDDDNNAVRVSSKEEDRQIKLLLSKY